MRGWGQGGIMMKLNNTPAADEVDTMADIKDRPAGAAKNAGCDSDEGTVPELEPWSEERIRRCDEWMKRFVGAVKMPFKVDVQEYFDRYAGDE